MTSRSKLWALTGASLAVAVSVSAAVLIMNLPATSPATAAGNTATIPAVPVTVAEVKSREITVWEDFSGRLEAIDRVQIRSRVAGAIQSVDFREGALVEAGDPLFTIDPAPYEAAVAQREGQVELAQTQLNLAKLELDRGNKLIENRTISQSVLDQRRNTYAEAQATLRTVKAALRSAKLELGYTKILAPVSGRVGKIEITVGNLVAAGSASPALTTLVSVDPIYASFNASEDLVSRVLAELPKTDAAVPPLDMIPVEIETSSTAGHPVKGKLQLVDNQVDAVSGTIGVRAVFDNPGGKLIPGQFVRIRMGEPRPEQKVLISERAIGTDQDKKYVYVVGDDNKAAYRSVELGRTAEGARIVNSGLKPGERIVVNGLQRIRSGALVDPQLENDVAAAN
ncbi:efflux RND transporter periplasmic adaptor subunit [Stappia sp. BW2]|jgi:multidrug efflux system membrane fusion protein|uniref:efflux RND transporter periplasmic adaptor subunit n=1 Tax=Stappia sp. BW2 TaxID=2592622 RepID=UPI0011DE59CD|nr:efflux RND transporter periplasmic adaptor subunit [Stappia sp. BW2]TYC75478.1 efflux RND transporter periplasmic adaptor subunit [Stappia sp. BW2]